MSDEIIRRNGRVYLVVHVVEPVESDDGSITFKNYDTEEDITGRENREHMFCKICKFGNYPECMNNCRKIKSDL